MTWQIVATHVAVQITLVCITVFLHAAAMLYVLRHFSRHLAKVEHRGRFVARAYFLFRMVLMIMLAHLVEMAVWGLGIHLTGVFPDLMTAYYFAIETYTTVGYGDVLPPAHWRMLSGALSVTGLLMFGWSTAVFATLVNRLDLKRLQSL